MSSLTVYPGYDSQERAWDAVLSCGGLRLKMAVTTAFLYGLAGRATVRYSCGVAESGLAKV